MAKGAEPVEVSTNAPGADQKNERASQASPEAGDGQRAREAPASTADGIDSLRAQAYKQADGAGFPVLTQVEVELKKQAECTVGPKPSSLILKNAAVTDAGLKYIGVFTDLTALNLSGTQITDAGAKHLANLHEIGILDLGTTRLTDKGISHLKHLDGLSHLYVQNTGLTDKGVVESIGRLRDLAFLDLSGTKVTDNSVPSLSRLSGLYQLALRDTGMTFAGISELRQDLPKCQVYYNGALDTKAEVIAELGPNNNHPATSLQELNLHRLFLVPTSSEKEVTQAADQLRGKIAPLVEGITPHGWTELLEKPSKQEFDKLATPDSLDLLRKDIKSIAGKHYDEKESFQFRLMMEIFSQRAERAQLEVSEQISTLLQVRRLLVADSDTTNGKNRDVLAFQVLQEAACPQSIDQGSHNTCNVTAVQSRLYTRNPSEAAKVVADMAIDGQFVTADGTKVKLLRESLTPDAEAREFVFNSGNRSYASQIFQLTAANIHWQRQSRMPGGADAGNGNIVFAQDAGAIGGTGEYLVNIGKDPPERQFYKPGLTDSPALGPKELADINSQIVGHRDQYFAVLRSLPGALSYFDERRGTGIMSVKSPAELRNVLTGLQRENKFPIVLCVDAKMPPFSQGNQNDFGPHAVTITGYDATKQLVYVDNQWGNSNDFSGKPGEKRPIPLDDLFLAMRRMPGNEPMPAYQNFFHGATTGFTGSLFHKSLRGELIHFPPVIKNLNASPGAVLGTAEAAGEAGVAKLPALGAEVEASLAGRLSSTSGNAAGKLSLIEGAELKAGSFRNAALGTGAALGSFGLFMLASGVPASFSRSTSEGVGRTLRASLDWSSFEIGCSIGISLGARSGPLRFLVPLASGLALSGLTDYAVGDVVENATRVALDRLTQ